MISNDNIELDWDFRFSLIQDIIKVTEIIINFLDSRSRSVDWDGMGRGLLLFTLLCPTLMAIQPTPPVIQAIQQTPSILKANHLPQYVIHGHQPDSALTLKAPDFVQHLKKFEVSYSQTTIYSLVLWLYSFIKLPFVIAINTNQSLQLLLTFLFHLEKIFIQFICSFLSGYAVFAWQPDTSARKPYQHQLCN